MLRRTSKFCKFHVLKVVLSLKSDYKGKQMLVGFFAWGGGF